MDLMTMTWERRDDFFFAVEPVEDSISRAKELTDGPIVLADHGDVAGSGGSTDVHTVLSEVIRQGLDSDLSRKIIKATKGTKIKVQIAVQGDALRVSGKKRDDLQETIAFIKELGIDQPMQYVNFRD